MRSLRIVAAILVAGAVGCVATACTLVHVRPSHPYYLTKPAQSYDSDSTIERVTVHVDERTMIWLGAMLAEDRREMRESGACLHLAAPGYIDSVYAARDQSDASWKAVSFHCPKDAAPLHFHIITKALEPWLDSQGYAGILSLLCTISDADKDPRWSDHPFNAMACGPGIDSLFVYRVRKR